MQRHNKKTKTHDLGLKGMGRVARNNENISKINAGNVQQERKDFE